jgi:hypothetical protein
MCTTAERPSTETDFTTGTRIDISHPITTIKTSIDTDTVTDTDTATIPIGATNHPTIVSPIQEFRTTVTRGVRCQESGSRSASVVGPAAHRLGAAHFPRDRLLGQGVFGSDAREFESIAGRMATRMPFAREWLESHHW